MNTLCIDDGMLIVEPRGVNKLWGFHRKLEFPLTHVIGATYDPQVHDEPKGFRGPGLATPGRWVGTFRRAGEKHYWCVKRGTRSIVISLKDEKFSRLFLTVDHAREMVDRINAAIGGERPPCLRTLVLAARHVNRCIPLAPIGEPLLDPMAEVRGS